MEYLLKMLFFANIASNLKVESMHFAHRNCEYILGVIYLLCFPVWLWADNKVNTYHFKSISTSVNFPTNEVRKLFQDSQGYILSLIHISEPTRQAEISYAVFCLKKKKLK